METPNLNYIKELSGGDVNFEETILSLLKKEFPIEYNLFKQNFNAEKYKEASANVHKIKHKISILGLKKGLKLASDFEKDLKVGNVKLYKEFIEILDKIHVYLDVNNTL